MVTGSFHASRLVRNVRIRAGEFGDSFSIAQLGLMRRAAGSLAVGACVVLAASLLLLASVVAASRACQVDDALVMHAIGARHLMAQMQLNPIMLSRSGDAVARVGRSQLLAVRVRQEGGPRTTPYKR